MEQIHLLSDLPFELEKQTCTCRRFASFKHEVVYSLEWRRSIHVTCRKPFQDQVIYQCADCEEYFISKTLYPTTQRPEQYKLQSVIYILRALQSPTETESSIYSKIKDVFCSACSVYQ